MAGNARVGLTLGAVLPLCTYLYTAQQKHIETERAQSAQRLEAQRLADEKDKETAQKLLSDFRGLSDTGGDSICKRYAPEISLMGTGIYGQYTLGVLVTLFTGAEGTGNTARPRLCTCPAVASAVIDNPLLDTQTGSAVPAKLVGKLNESLGHCAAATASAAAAVRSTPHELPTLATTMPPPQSSPPPGSGRAPASASPPVLALPPLNVPGTSLGPPVANLTMQTPAPPPPADLSFVRIYLQIVDEPQRLAALCLQTQLKARGYTVPAIEKVGARAPNQAELRSTYAEDRPVVAGLADALPVALGACRAISTLLPATFKATAPMSAYRDRIPRYRLELWFPRLAPKEKTPEKTQEKGS